MKTFKKIIITILCVILATALVWGILFLTVPKVKDKTYEFFNIQQDKQDDKQDETTEDVATALYTLTLNVSNNESVICEVKLYVQDKEIESGYKLTSGEKVKGEITLLPTEAQKDKEFFVLVGLIPTNVDNLTFLTTTKLDNLNYTFEFEMLSENVEVKVGVFIDAKFIILN